MTTTIAGRLFIHSETGTEGGYWAIQDKNFITPASDKASDKVCRHCGRIWSGFEKRPEPKPFYTYYSEEVGGYTFSEVYDPEGRTWFRGEEPGSINDKWTKASNQMIKDCQDNGHQWEDYGPHEHWSYEGLNYIQDGDYITVFDGDDESSPIFEGTVRLVQQPDQYAPDAKHAGGLVIHSYPHPEFCEHEQWCEYFSRDYLGVITR